MTYLNRKTMNVVVHLGHLLLNLGLLPRSPYYRILLSSANAASYAAACATRWAYNFSSQCYNAKQTYIEIE